MRTEPQVAHRLRNAVVRGPDPTQPLRSATMKKNSRYKTFALRSALVYLPRRLLPDVRCLASIFLPNHRYPGALPLRVPDLCNAMIPQPPYLVYLEYLQRHPL